MHHLPEHINQDITRRQSKDKDSTVNKTEYRSKRNPTGKPRWARQTVLDVSIYMQQTTSAENISDAFFSHQFICCKPSYAKI